VNIQARGSYEYFVTFIDDYSWYMLGGFMDYLSDYGITSLLAAPGTPQKGWCSREKEPDFFKRLLDR
jgi:hypothetical protein